MDHRSWMNLLKTQFKVGEQKLIMAGIDITYESTPGYYGTFSTIKEQTQMMAKVTLMSHYGPERVTIEGDAELVHTILEKLK